MLGVSNLGEMAVRADAAARRSQTNNGFFIILCLFYLLNLLAQVIGAHRISERPKLLNTIELSGVYF